MAQARRSTVIHDHPFRAGIQRQGHVSDISYATCSHGCHSVSWTDRFLRHPRGAISFLATATNAIHGALDHQGGLECISARLKVDPGTVQCISRPFEIGAGAVVV
jgi:hypothetical protein